MDLRVRNDYMMYSLFHPGSGVGDQLFCYLAARITAERLGVPFEMAGEFKGKDFIKLDYLPFTGEFKLDEQKGKITIPDKPLFESTTGHYNPEFNFIEDGTVVDGCSLQDEKYWDIEKVREWLKTEPLEMPDDLCVIGFRGGEYTIFPDLFLTKEYWAEAKILMLQKNINMRFEVHTDDPQTAKQFFPDYKVIHDVGLNWRSVRYAKYAIIANSSFYILPRLLNGGYTVAPRYWAGRNVGEWQRPQNYYKQFTYI